MLSNHTTPQISMRKTPKNLQNPPKLGSGSGKIRKHQNAPKIGSWSGKTRKWQNPSKLGSGSGKTRKH